MATNYWQQALSDVQSGKRTDFTPLTSNIQSFQDWYTPQRQSFYGARDAAAADGRIGFREGMGQGFTDNPAEYDYLKQFYNVPSYDKSQFGNMALAGLIGGGIGLANIAGAAGAAGAAPAAAEAAPIAGSTGPGVSAAYNPALGGGYWAPAVDTAANVAPQVVGSTALGRLTGMGQTGQDILSVGGAVAPGILGYFGAGKQQDAFKDVANQYFNIGAPYRDTLQQSYQPGFDLMSQPGYGDAFNRAAEISARAASAKFGNPADSPSAQASIMNDVWSQNYLPALSNYRGQLGQFSGLGLNTSGAASMGGADVAGGQYDALGLGLGRLMNPQPNIYEMLGLTQGNGINLTIGGRRY